MPADEEEIAEIHIIPETEDQNRHWRNENCWCEPEEGDIDDYPEIAWALDDDEEFILLVHRVTH
jgi:hypothetical protein